LKEVYEAQTRLLISILPRVRHPDFALKGGTAINLFYRDFPRLSVDIDLTYLPIKDREQSFSDIHCYLSELQSNLIKAGLKCRSDRPLDGKSEAKLTAAGEGVQIKIEPNFILRGTVEPVEIKSLSDKVFRKFGSTQEIECLGFNDLYGGKICAALSRKHPRDLFDIYHLLNNEGISESLKDVFLYYLICSSRPFHEILDARWMDIDAVFRDKFQGMSDESISVDILKESFFALKNKLKKMISEEDKEFLISLLNLTPDWSLYEFDHIRDFPAFRWRMFNLKKMDGFKRSMQIKTLRKSSGY